MWYVIQTITGGEELLIRLFKEMIPEEYYRECFYIKRESASKEDDGWHIREEVMFPGYFFVDTENPKEIYMSLKQIPKLTKLLREESETFLAVSEEEQQFLEEIQSAGHIVRRSLVRLDTDRKIIEADGPVGRYIDSIVRQRVRKRYVLIEKTLLGEKRKILFGIRLEEDKLTDG